MEVYNNHITFRNFYSRVSFCYCANSNIKFYKCYFKFFNATKHFSSWRIIFGFTVKKRQIFGVIIGLIGSSVLILNGAVTHPNQNYYYTILVIIASLCYAINVNLIKKHLSNLTPLSITAGNFAVLLLPALVVLYFAGFDEIATLPATQHAILFILILGIIGTGVANIIFFKLIQISSPIFATSVTYLIPVVAFFWGLLDQEVLTATQFLGAFIVLVGVYLANKK